MLTARANYHHSKLPQLGDVGYITNGKNRWGERMFWKGRKRLCVVESFPLCDNVLPYGRGIHTVTVRFLDNGETARFSGFYFTNREEM